MVFAKETPKPKKSKKTDHEITIGHIPDVLAEALLPVMRTGKIYSIIVKSQSCTRRKMSVWWRY